MTGLRPGEKLYEELLIDLNSSAPTSHPKIRKALEPTLGSDELQSELRDLEYQLGNGDVTSATQRLMRRAT